MNELRIFNNADFGEIRTVEQDGNIWFVGKDVAEALGYERPTKAVQDHIDEEDKDVVPIQDSIGRKQIHLSSTNQVYTALYFPANCLKQKPSNAGLRQKSFRPSARLAVIASHKNRQQRSRNRERKPCC